ncbi:MAG: hypothetical protein LIP12_06425 [Clostridiales bacterium]|nr:hypothetical protein [Clostridiales bacterium]
MYIAEKKGVTPEKIERFRREINNPKPYILRGTNAEKARREGRPLKYDRLCLFAISIRHLAHWRIDVTVNSYLQ